MAKRTNTEAAAPQQAPRYRFKGGATEVMHPFLGVLTLEHLANPVIIAALRRCDERKDTTEFVTTNLEEE
jgi:hypothetical protein